EGAVEALESLQADVSRLEGEAENLTKLLEQLADAERKAGEQVVKLESAADTAVKDLPVDLRDPDAFAAALHGARQAAESLAQRFTAAANELDAAKRGVSDARKDVAQLTGRLKTAEETIAARSAEFDERLKASGFASLEELDSASLPEDALAERVEELRRYGENRLSAATTASNLEKKLKGREVPDLAALRAALDEATEAAE